MHHRQNPDTHESPQNQRLAHNVSPGSQMADRVVMLADGRVEVMR
jgi:hypothetical protein